MTMPTEMEQTEAQNRILGNASFLREILELRNHQSLRMHSPKNRQIRSIPFDAYQGERRARSMERSDGDGAKATELSKPGATESLRGQCQECKWDGGRERAETTNRE